MEGRDSLMNMAEQGSIKASKAICYTISIIIIIIGIVSLTFIPVAGFVGIIIGFIALFAFKRGFRGL